MEVKKYDCICMKCHQTFVSEKEMDTDGDGRCEKCDQEVKAMALKIDEIIAERRKNRPPPPPKREIREVDGYINARQLM